MRAAANVTVAHTHIYPRLRARAGAQSDRGVRFMRERENEKAPGVAVPTE